MGVATPPLGERIPSVPGVRPDGRNLAVTRRGRPGHPPRVGLLWCASRADAAARRAGGTLRGVTDSLARRATAALAIPLQDALRARALDPADPTAGVVFPVAGLAINPGGTLHAGALGAIMELTGFLALLPHLAGTEHAVTHHISTQILSPGRAGEEVTVTASVERRTRRLGFVTATAMVGERLVARSQITKSVIEIR